jgi:hypothetical protein
MKLARDALLLQVELSVCPQCNERECGDCLRQSIEQRNIFNERVVIKSRSDVFCGLTYSSQIL